MINIDFHGYSLEEAVSFLEKIINNHILKNELISYRLIVGHGVIKNKFLKILEEYDCEASIEIGNSGAIIAHIGIFN